MIRGQITNGIGGLYTVITNTGDEYKCKARGLFRKQKIKPIVGDYVEIEINKDGTGYIQEINPRKTELIRPAVANIDQIVIVFSIKSPDINYNLLDKFLVMSERKGIDTIICFNKVDLVDKEEIEEVKAIYEKAGYEVIVTSAKYENGIEELKESLKNKTNAFAGPSGVGKSSLLNDIQKGLNLRTGEISEKAQRGKHTTRSVELIKLDFGGYVLDTPGFTSLELNDLDERELKDYFREFEEHAYNCKFGTCQHITEPKCAVKVAVENQEISKERYERYIEIYEQLKNKR